MSWTIKGEAGAALDATVRTLASFNVDSAKLTLASLDSDKFEWSAVTSDPTGAGTIVPDAGQLVEVFYSGVRRFRGHVTIPRVSTGRVSVVCEGPWWWMTRIPLTQVVADDTAATATRPSYVFVTQSLKTSLEALIDRGIANGVPMIRGTVATMFDFPRITLSEKSIAQAMAELMSVCPDAVAYFDYSGASGTYPILNITRRGSMTATTLTLGTDAIEGLDLAPRLDLEVSRVEIGSTTRNATTGANTWATQTSGTSVPGKNQILVTSGPEIVAFLPKDKSNSFQCQSVALPTTGTLYSSVTDATTASSPSSITGSGSVYNYIAANDPTALKILQKHPTVTIRILTGGRNLYSALQNGTGGGYQYKSGRPEFYSKASLTGKFAVISPDRVPDWVRDENGWETADCTVDYFMCVYQFTATEPAWYATARELGGELMQGYVPPFGGGGYGFGAYWKASLQIPLVSVQNASLTTIIRQWEYDYINPPAGLAANLLATQNWIPYEGEIRTVADTVDGTQDLFRKYNVAGSLTAHGSMAALPKRIVYDIQRGRKTIALGCPARVDFGSLASKFRRSPKDNIVYL